MKTDTDKLPTVRVTAFELNYKIETTRGSEYTLSIWLDGDQYLWWAKPVGQIGGTVKSDHFHMTHESAYADALANIGWLA